ncbi:Cysteine proteinase inhibitor [Heracleum sosnowskyi]|uniref:Cysteine proteinase inhibitor n=1 Tax=Heracleum sosnowskyi TaxID=360622 RepID=A0AAD8M5A2_9APIA|nr:Cysteine proteinase inhibitor [Heracleum sosnowskyi]
MALRLILGSRRNITRTSACPMLWGPVHKKVWSPPSCSSTSSSCNSCYYIHNHPGFDMYNIINGDGVKTQENLKSFCGGTFVYQGAQNDDWIISLAKFGVTAHNENQNADINFVRVVGASHTGLSSLLYHITLEATEGRKHRIFHAVVWLQPLKNSMEVLVWKRVHDALSTIGVKCGDSKLHEAVMHFMSRRKESSFIRPIS